MSTNQVALAGEFAVLSQLYFRGYDASLTLGNTKGVDIFVSNPDTGKLLKIEVKTKTGIKGSTERNQFGPAYSWQMNEKHEEIVETNLYYCFVSIGKCDDNMLSYNFFIVPSNIVAKYVREEHRWWQNLIERKQTSKRTFRLGTNNKFEYPVKTPLSSKYENNWNILQ